MSIEARIAEDAARELFVQLNLAKPDAFQGKSRLQSDRAVPGL